MTWRGRLILTVLFLEVRRLHCRTDVLAQLRENFPNGWPVTGGRNAATGPAKPVADIRTLPG